MKISTKLKTLPLCAWPRELRNKKFKLKYIQSDKAEIPRTRLTKS